MKKTFYIFFMFMLFAGLGLQAQNYYCLKGTGTTSEYVFNNLGTYYWQGNATGYPDTLITSTLPFSWSFYGQPVTSVKISDNGYVTFDSAESVSNPNNETLPSATAPKSAIFALWDALVNVDPDGTSTKTNLIHTWSYGTAPNRVFVIHWFRMFLEPYSSSTVSQFCFGIRLFESGPKAFDIVLDYNYLPSGGTAKSTSATIGCQNADASLGVAVETSPNYVFPNITSANTDDVVFEFYYGTQPDYDMAMVSLNINDMANFNKANPVSGIVRNMGSQTVNSFDVKYMVDGNTTKTSFTQTLAPGASYTFAATPYTPTSGSGQNHEIVVWVENINSGQTDLNHANDSLNKNVFVNLGVSAVKRVLIEEFTTVPCGFCPDGHIVLENIIENYPDVIGVCHHAGYGTDAMTVTVNSTLATDFADGAPTAAIDRHRFPGDAGNIAISRNQWESAATERLNVPAPCKLEIYGNYDKSTRTVNATVKTEFVDYALPGDLRISLYIIEDHVSNGTGTNWDQTNYYYNTSGHPMYHVGVPYNSSSSHIPGYDHRHVVRGNMSPVWGTSGVISNNPAPGEIKTRSYSTTLNSVYQEDSVFLVAFVSYYNADKDKRDILNSFKVRLLDMPNWAQSIPEKVEESSIKLYPNPVNNIVSVDFALDKTRAVSVDVVNTLGQKVLSFPSTTYAAGNSTIYLSTGNLEKGTYIALINIDGNSFTRKLIKVD